MSKMSKVALSCHKLPYLLKALAFRKYSTQLVFSVLYMAVSGCTWLYVAVHGTVQCLAKSFYEKKSLIALILQCPNS